jgi:hypothetical protein
MSRQSHIAFASHVYRLQNFVLLYFGTGIYYFISAFRFSAIASQYLYYLKFSAICCLFWFTIVLYNLCYWALAYFWYSMIPIWLLDTFEPLMLHCFWWIWSLFRHDFIYRSPRPHPQMNCIQRHFKAFLSPPPFRTNSTPNCQRIFRKCRATFCRHTTYSIMFH